MPGMPEEYPASNVLCHDRETAEILNARYPIRFDHNTVVERYKKAGRPFSWLPFRSTVYVLGGDNISSIYHAMHNTDGKDRLHHVAFLRSLNVF